MQLEKRLKTMDRLEVLALDNTRFVIGEELTSKSFVIDCAKLPDRFSINIKDNVRANVLIINIKDSNDIHFVLDEYVSLHLAMLAVNSVTEFKLTADLGKYAEIDAYLADFIQNKNKSQINVNLNGEESACAWHLASLANEKDEKSFDVSVFHNTKNTYCKLDNYGVCLGESKLTFSGICKINEGCSGSKAHQNAKIMVFDEACKGIAKPILKIDENDIEASHAAVVGKINDDHLFYLTSRGLSESQAKELITLGYLNPILKGFDDQEMKDKISSLIEGRI